MELKEGSKRMVAPRIVTRDQVGMVRKQISGLIAIREVANGGDLKGLGLEIEILLML